MSFLTEKAQMIQAHFKTKLAMIEWGSSGYGKTSSYESAAVELGYDLVTFRVANHDSLSLFLPILEKTKLTYAYADILTVLFEANKPTVALFDEITNPSGKEIYNVLKEIFGERTFLGRKLSDNVVLVAASNLSIEDKGVVDLPKSLMQRLTHLKYMPSPEEMVRYMRPLAQKFYSQPTGAALMVPGKEADFRLEWCPRQSDNVEKLATVGGLRGTALRRAAIGRIGLEAGVAFAGFLEDELDEDKKAQAGKTELDRLLATLPSMPTRDAIPTLLKMEDKGYIQEIVSYITKDLAVLLKMKADKFDRETRKKDKPEYQEYEAGVAKYLGFFASPEIVRMMFDRKDIRDLFVEMDDLAEVQHEAKEPIIWPLPAFSRYALEVGNTPDNPITAEEKTARLTRYKFYRDTYRDGITGQEAIKAIEAFLEQNPQFRSSDS